MIGALSLAFGLAFGLLFLLYSIAVIIIASVEIKLTTDIANSYYWSEGDLRTIKIAKRFLYSLFISVPLCVLCLISVYQNLKPDEGKDYNISIKDVPEQLAPKIIFSDKDTGDIMKEINL